MDDLSALWDQNSSHSAKDDRILLTELWPSTGILDDAFFAATQTSPSETMAVTLTEGRAVVPGNSAADEGNYLVGLGVDGDVTVTAAHGSLNRIDLIVLEVTPGVGDGAGTITTEGYARVRVVAGTPSATPVAPATPVRSIALWTIGTIVPSTTFITNAMLTDVRPRASLGVRTVDLVDSSVTTAKIASQAVTAAKIANNTITASQIASQTITGGRLANQTITSSQIAADTITAGQIAADAVTASELASNAVIEAKIADGAVTAQKLGTGAVTNTTIGTNAVSETKIGAGAVSQRTLAAPTGSAVGGITYRRLGDIVFAWGTATSASTVIPVGWRPAATVSCVGVSASDAVATITIATSGSTFASNAGTFAFNAAYLGA